MDRNDRAILETELTFKPFMKSKPTVIGSSYISDRTSSDVDVLFLVEDMQQIGPDAIEPEGWTVGGSGGGTMGGWLSFKKTLPDGLVINALMTDSREYLDAWIISARVCRFIHLMGVELPNSVVHGIHGVIMDGSSPDVEAGYRSGAYEPLP